MKYLIVPELIYIVLLYGGIVFSLVSVIMGIRGVIKKNERRYFLKWGVVLLFSLAAAVLAATGVFVANTMLGG